MRRKRGNPIETYYIGADPGLSGGIAILNETGCVEVFKTPRTATEFYERLSKYTDKPIHCIIEKVHSMPQNGAKANFTFGNVVGVLHTVFELCVLPFELSTPQEWMKLYGFRKQKGESGTDWKNRLKDHAQRLFPDVKVTLWSADALLIAYYCRDLNE